MNKPYALAPLQPPVPIGPAAQRDDDINFLGIIDTLLNSRWLIAGTLMIFLLAGGAYALLRPPVYQADVLIQVEQNQPSQNPNNILGELATVFNIQSPATAEIEILRSRLVVGQASDDLQLYVEATPNYIPLVGSWLAKHAETLSNPRLIELGSYNLAGYRWTPRLGGYVWGNESIRVAQLDVPADLENKKLTLTVTATGYELHGPRGQRLAVGKVGVPSQMVSEGELGTILISSLNAKPDAQFTLVRGSRLQVIHDLQQKLIINEKGKPSGVLSMALDGTEPTKIAAVLNAIGSAYVKQNTERKAAEAEKTLIFLDDFLPQLRKQMDESDNRYTAFRDKNGTFNLGTEGTLSLETSVGMQTKLFELQQRRRELSAQFGSDHPSIQAIDKQIKAFNIEVDRLAAHIKTLPELEQQLLNLVRDVKVNGELYASLLNSAQQMRLVKEGKVGNVRLVDTAVPPEEPFKPDRPLVLLIAALAGLLLGMALALVRGLLRPGVKAANDIEFGLGLNVLATVPHVLPGAWRQRRLGASKSAKFVLAENSPNDPAIESLRSLRTALQFELQGAENNIVMLTGPTPNIGKTFTSVNLAAVLGSADKRVLLIDADFRSGRVHRYFGLERYQGFSELIRGNVSLQQVLHQNVLQNVDVITTGVLPHNPAELLLSPSAKEWLDRLSELYDVVLLDTAPVLAVSDAMALAGHAGTVFMLARAEVSTLGELEESTKRLNQAGAQVKGVIFNDFDAASNRFSIRYGSYHHSYANYGQHRS
ncbi:MAG TPA: polysaccharide biosynthesis tyrosine autokinase [Candidimonas sp.]|nr:polysaccharide biosynthesis tyrosine autokinase [Candidimonas sp.]